MIPPASLVNYDDVEPMVWGDKLTCSAGSTLQRTGWKAGTFAMYVAGSVGEPYFTVERSDGIGVAGFILYGSEDYSDTRIGGYHNYTSIQKRYPNGPNTITVMIGGGRYFFRNYEKVALAADGTRTGGPAVYGFNNILKVSENGLLCNDPDGYLLLATGGAVTVPFAMCSRPPVVDDPRMGVDMRY